MRVSEEIDALEVMAVPALRYLVVDPARRQLRHRPAALRHRPVRAADRHPADVGAPVRRRRPASTTSTSSCTCRAPTCSSASLKVARVRHDGHVHPLLLRLHTPRGGPEGVGQAVGRSVRLSVTLIFVVNFLLSLRVLRRRATRSGSPDERARCAGGHRGRGCCVGLSPPAVRGASPSRRAPHGCAAEFNRAGLNIRAGDEVRRAGRARRHASSASRSTARTSPPATCWRSTPATRVAADSGARLVPKTLFGDKYVELDAARDGRGRCGGGRP